ncbi:isochorismatase family protein [Streptomyces sp. NBC_01803]|uniref:isochorismatase family protein n=1 Tax=Streptomyces sp. NBC_01803 TaxID=2975946 RepID=UPI002DD89EC6|nr:isochorismatase family protein [Streptomyces sp. NBC_01803]WSA43822.1 isochorismatase family protein [Streptomyces sp. NBC_01803]
MASVLLLLDVQKNMLLPPAPVLGAAAVSAAIEELLGRARSAGSLVVHVRNGGVDGDPDEPGTPGWELIHEIRAGEHVVDKAKPDAFAGTGLGSLIPVGSEMVVAGMQSEFCVRATARAALDRGHRVVLVRGAHGTYEARVPREIEAELRAAGVTVSGPEAVKFEKHGREDGI